MAPFSRQSKRSEGWKAIRRPNGSIKFLLVHVPQTDAPFAEAVVARAMQQIQRELIRVRSAAAILRRVATTGSTRSSRRDRVKRRVVEAVRDVNAVSVQQDLASARRRIVSDSTCTTTTTRRAITAAVVRARPDDFVLDTVATSVCIRSTEYFQGSPELLPPNQTVRLAEGPVMVSQKGPAELPMLFPQADGTYKLAKVVVKDCFYAPGISQNVLSWRCLERNSAHNKLVLSGGDRHMKLVVQKNGRLVKRKIPLRMNDLGHYVLMHPRDFTRVD